MTGTRDKAFHNAGWYNSNGNKLGWGDLSHGDLDKILKALQPGELFIILHEQDSFWNFVTAIGPIGSMCKVKSEEQKPALDYLAEHAACIVGNGQIRHIDRYSKDVPSEEELLKLIQEGV